MYDLKKAEKENRVHQPKTVREYFQERRLEREKCNSSNANGTKTKSKSTPALIKNDIFSNLHSASTVSSRARSNRPTSSEDSRIQNFYDIPNRPADSRLFPSACTFENNDCMPAYISNPYVTNQRIKSAGCISQRPSSSCKNFIFESVFFLIFMMNIKNLLLNMLCFSYQATEL